MFVAVRDAYQTNARGDVKVIKTGQTITPAQFRKLNDNLKLKFVEVEKEPKVAKVKVSREDELERLAHKVLAELRMEHQLATSTVDFEQFSNVIPGWVD